MLIFFDKRLVYMLIVILVFFLLSGLEYLCEIMNFKLLAKIFILPTFPLRKFSVLFFLFINDNG